jgi:hypothetical protein
MNRKENFTKQITESCISKAVSIFLERAMLMSDIGVPTNSTKTLSRHGLIAGATGIRKTKLFKFYVQLSTFRITVLMYT